MTDLLDMVSCDLWLLVSTWIISFFYFYFKDDPDPLTLVMSHGWQIDNPLHPPNPPPPSSFIMLPENTPSSSSSCLLHSNLWFYLWIPLLTSSLSKRITLAEAHNINTNSIMLPIELDLSSPSSSYHHHFLSPPSPSPRCSAPDSTLNFRPVIGILSHPGDGASGRLKNGTNVSYIASSYVKFVESAGARVIPLIYTDPLHILLDVSHFVFLFLFLGVLQLYIMSNSWVLWVLFSVDFRFHRVVA